MTLSVSKQVNPVRKSKQEATPSFLRKGQVSNEVKILSLAFLFIFLGFNGVQSYVTTYFSEGNLAEVGFRSLILIYLFFILFDPLSAVFVSKYGAKRCMVLASLFYSIFIVSLLSKSVPFIYISSSLLGIAASFLWTGQNSYLIRASEKESYGANAGFFSSFQSFGSAAGVLFLGFLVASFYFKLPFLIFSILPLFGFLLLFKLQDIKAEQKLDHFKLIKRCITSKTVWRLSTIGFSFMFVYGLIIGVVPIEIKNTIGVSSIGILSSLFYIMPILFAYLFGKFSDIKGRKIMIIYGYVLCIIGLISLYFAQGPILLIFGIVLLALNYAIIRPATMALVGDVATKSNLEFLTALFWMVQNIGVVSALIISSLLFTKTIYLISILAIGLSLFILLPLLRLKIDEIREKISQEVN